MSSGGGDTLAGLRRLVVVKSTGLYDPQRSLMFKVQEPEKQKIGLLHLEFHQVGSEENKQEQGLQRPDIEGFE